MEPAPARRLGEVLAGKYRLERLLGVGGMGAVYEAVHIGVEKRFAVKVLKADSARAPDSATRFTQEARAAARIGHPNLVEVFDLGETEEGTLYMVMELLVGRSLFDALRDGPLPTDEALNIASAMLSALDAAHRAGFVHRDIKPANIFLANRLTESGHGQARAGYAVKLLDFGIAKLVTPDTPSLTQSGMVVGTPLYMAPEQVMAEREVDGRADVWAVGATLFEMLTGRPVHLATTATAAAVKVVTEVAPRVRSLRPEVDAGVDGLVARALAVDRAARFATAGEMLAELEACRTGLGPTQADSGLAPSVATVVRQELQARTRRNRMTMLGAGAASLLLGVIAVFAWRSHGVAAGSAQPPQAVDGALQPLPATALPPPTALAMATAVAVPPASASATVTAPPTATATASATATAMPSAKVTSPPATTQPTAKRPPVAPTPACAANEHPSKGHCCPTGLEYQADHCDRPLATKVPF